VPGLNRLFFSAGTFFATFSFFVFFAAFFETDAGKIRKRIHCGTSKLKWACFALALTQFHKGFNNFVHGTKLLFV